MELKEARRVLEIEAQAILEAKDRLGDSFVKAVDLLCQCKGKVIITGMGKSGHVGRKMAATMSSTGTPSLYLHPAESSHGDLGVVTVDDILVVISYGGGSQEINDVLSYAIRKGIPMIAMTGNPASQLAEVATCTIDVSVREEACPLKLAPTASTAVTMALGDALAMTVLKKKGFKEEDFAEFHPGGRLGRRLLTRVRDLMHENGHLPVVQSGSPMKDVIGVMAGSEVRGVAAVIDGSSNLVGVITDGDLRRHLQKNQNPLDCKVDDLMSRQPKTISADELAVKAMFVMEQFTISSLFVIDSQNRKPVGLIHLQDLIRAKIR